MRIALVDDDAEDRALLRRQLAACPSFARGAHSVAEFDNGLDLLRSANTFHLVFLDIMMDDPDGIAVASALRRRPAAPLVVLVSSSPEYLRDGYRAHVFDYLVKGFDVAQLEHTLKDALIKLTPPPRPLRAPSR